MAMLDNIKDIVKPYHLKADSIISDVNSDKLPSVSIQNGMEGCTNSKSTLDIPHKNGLQKLHLQRSHSEACFSMGFKEEKPQHGCLVHSLSDKHLQEGVRTISLESIDFQGVKTDENKNDLLQSNTFAGRRDVTNPESVKERTIISRRGSIRGYKNRVRAGIATFRQINQGNKQRNYTEEEKGKIVLYSTSMAIVRETYERCLNARKILQTHMVRYEERDLFMSSENQKDLRERLEAEPDERIILPQVFADGIPLGSLEEIENLNEDGELRNVFANFTKICVRSSCDKCGGYRYVPCTFCHGSKKSLKRNHFTEEFSSLRCMQCDENGLLRCDLCLDQQE